MTRTPLWLLDFAKLISNRFFFFWLWAKTCSKPKPKGQGQTQRARALPNNWRDPLFWSFGLYFEEKKGCISLEKMGWKGMGWGPIPLRWWGPPPLGQGPQPIPFLFLAHFCKPLETFFKDQWCNDFSKDYHYWSQPLRIICSFASMKSLEEKQ